MLITELGYFFLLLAFVLATLQAVLPTLGILNSRWVLWQHLASGFALAGFFALLMSFVCLMAGFYYNDFSLLYVANHSNSLLPWYYKLSATWGGHEGSLLLWLVILAGWVASVAIFSRALPMTIKVRVLAILGMIQTLMTAMLIMTSSPFERSLPVLPVDGTDLNPLLQDIGLIIHPPMLYMGYVGMAIPFAFCMAALWAGRLDAVWTRWSRPWALMGWACLTLGIALGSWWAYYELGWGGWWFWDPVENASLMPWLASTALLHSLAATEHRGVFKAWTIMLAIFSFALSLLGTFLVRSGIITSVHSFASDPMRGFAILLILGVVIGASLALFALRGWRLTVESRYELKSRETFLVINNVILLIATLVVLLGTLYPIIADSFNLGQVSVGAPYFNVLFVPLTWLLLTALGVGATMRYKQDKRSFGKKITVIASSTVFVAIIAYMATVHIYGLHVTWAIWLSICLCAWVLGFMVMDIKDKIRHNSQVLVGLGKLSRSYWGMQIAHFGLLCVVVGVAVVSHLSVERDVAMHINDSLTVQGYEFYLHRFDDIQGTNYDATQATIAIKKDGKLLGMVYPQKRHYVVTQMSMTEVGLHAKLWQDIYVALGDPIENDGRGGQSWAVRIYIRPMVRFIWLGAVIMALGAVFAMSDRRYRLSATIQHKKTVNHTLYHPIDQPVK